MRLCPIPRKSAEQIPKQHVGTRLIVYVAIPRTIPVQSNIKCK